MAIYLYKALNKSGQEIKSSLNAETLQQAKNLLKNQGLMLLDIKVQESQNSTTGWTIFQPGVSIDELSIFTRQFATLLGAKFQVLEALNTLYEQIDNPTLKQAIGHAKQQVSEGISLSKSLEIYPNIFNSIFVNMIGAGESSGNLDVVLLKLAEFTEAQRELKNKLKSALTYPIIILVFGLIMVLGMFTFVIPQLASIFKSSGQELPLLTQICLDISEFILQKWYYLIFYLVSLGFILHRFFTSYTGQRFYDQAMLKWPLVGTLTIAVSVERLASTLSTLLASGVPLLPAMRIVKNLMTNSYLKEVLDHAQISVGEGKSLYLSLSEGGYFPSTFLHMVQLGEKSGELEKLLAIVSKVYKDEADTKINGLTAALNPLLMIFLGGVVGTIVFAVVMPIMNMGNM